jgi:hypothetical protein
MPSKTFAEQLNINRDKSLTLFNSPENAKSLLDGISQDISISEGDSADILLAFIDNQDQLKRSLLALKSNIKEDGALWLVWRKNDAEASLYRSFIDECAPGKRLQKTTVIDFNEQWKALQLKIMD